MLSKVSSELTSVFSKRCQSNALQLPAIMYSRARLCPSAVDVGDCLKQHSTVCKSVGVDVIVLFSV